MGLLSSSQHVAADGAGLSVSVTITSGTTKFIVAAGTRNGDATVSCTLNGSALTLDHSQTAVSRELYLFYTDSPPAPGSYTLAITEGDRLRAVAMCWDGLAAGDAEQVGQASVASVTTITATLGGSASTGATLIGVGGCTSNISWTESSGQTMVQELGGTGMGMTVAYEVLPSGGTESMTWGAPFSTTMVAIVAAYAAADVDEAYGVSTETDTAVALVGSAHASYGVTTETDSAVALVGRNSGAYGVATEADSAVALTATNQATFGVSTETDAAVALAGFESVAYGVATETDEALALETGDIYPGVSLETDTAIALVGSDHAAYGVATETDAALALVGSAQASYGAATETDSAVALVGSLAATYGIATEADLAIALTMVGPHVLAPPERTFSDDAWSGAFADEAHLSTIYDAPASLTFAD